MQDHLAQDQDHLAQKQGNLANIDRTSYPQQSSAFDDSFPFADQSDVFAHESSAFPDESSAFLEESSVFHRQSRAFGKQDSLADEVDDDMLFETEHQATPSSSRARPSVTVPSQQARSVSTKRPIALSTSSVRQANQLSSDGSDSDSEPAGSRPIQAHQAKRRALRMSKASKKNRKATELPLRVWLNSRWAPIEKLIGEDVRTAVQAAFAELSSSKAAKQVWARWTDPSVTGDHYEQCIGHGLNAKSGRQYPQRHRACEWCVNTERLCAVLHAGTPSAFVGILPRKRELRVGREPSEIEYWMGD